MWSGYHGIYTHDLCDLHSPVVMRVCECVCVCVNACVGVLCVCVFLWERECACMHMHVYTCVCVCVCMCVPVCGYEHAHVRACLHAFLYKHLWFNNILTLDPNWLIHRECSDTLGNATDGGGLGTGSWRKEGKGVEGEPSCAPCW